MADKPFVKTMTDYMICEKSSLQQRMKTKKPVVRFVKILIMAKTRKGASRNKHVKSYVLCPTCHYANMNDFGLGNEDEKRIFDYETGKYRKK